MVLLAMISAEIHDASCQDVDVHHGVDILSDLRVETVLEYAVTVPHVHGFGHQQGEVLRFEELASAFLNNVEDLTDKLFFAGWLRLDDSIKCFHGAE